MLATALWGAVSSALKAGKSAPDEASEPKEDEALTQLPELYPWLVWLAVAATLAYLFLLPFLGFFIATIIYSCVLMYLGHYRQPLAGRGAERSDRARLHVHVHARRLRLAAARRRAIR